MNDDVTITSGSRWEPAQGAPLLPPEPAPADPPSPGTGGGPLSRFGRKRRTPWFAGGAAAAVLAAGLGGFAVGHATAPAGGDGGPGVFQQDGRHGFPGDQFSDDGDGAGLPPQQQQQPSGSDAEGSDT